MFTAKDIRYAFYVLTHPLDGFWDLKHEKRGKLSLSVFFLVLWFLTNIYEHIGMAYIMNQNYGVPLDILAEFRSVFLPFIVFCIGNWSVTTLMDGKGYFKDIVMVYGYTSLALTVIRIPIILISHFVGQSEITYLQFGISAAWIIFLILLFFGIMMIHEYSVTKAIATALLTVISMAIIVFLLIVCYNIFAQLYSFVLALSKELRLRF